MDFSIFAIFFVDFWKKNSEKWPNKFVIDVSFYRNMIFEPKLDPEPR